jgi:hypothetical protein
MDDDFVPEGRVPLKSAIKQLAKARQTNVPSVQAEIQAKLHSGSIVAQAMERSTGRMLDIIPGRWATETALRWLKSGTCLLPDENGKVRITTQRFDMFYRPEHATIFIWESHLRPLIDAERKGASARKARRKVISNAEATRLFEEWRKSRGDDIPSQKEDVSHMGQFGVSRRRVVGLRKGVGVRKRPRGNPGVKPK